MGSVSYPEGKTSIVVPNSPIHNMKASIHPAYKAGFVNGTRILHIALRQDTPATIAASSKDDSTCLNPVDMDLMPKGAKRAT